MRRLNFIEWWLTYVWYHIQFNKYVVRIQKRIRLEIEFFCIAKRLRSKNCSKAYALNVVKRFVRMKIYREKSEDRRSRRMLNDIVVEIASKTGEPQWEVRERINRDFNVDI